ncbi:hypothetical protein F53441_11988 [Fusarium austroafricanum]|uniref:C3H1-type domain-containing protein n=1 Tax=Fusarium austroafricanum TaxID=2364996 RepID=A0A8H4NKJ9_9HYPO|nr:hypothetical protein F53441_11988 [Fusarium austroafricanum]
MAIELEALFAHIDSQSSQLSKATSELEDKDLVIKGRREDSEKLKAQIRELQQDKDRHAFVFVVIDGDCMLFRDDLVQAGLEGGKQAISQLKQSVESKVKALNSATPPHLQIIVRVYANLKGLAQAYQSSGVLSSGAILEDFVRGFNMGDPLCDFVDAGNGKECADEKVKAMFRHYLDDVHCRQVFFGASADNGYARLLGPYAQDGKHKQRICLIEGPPFQRELAELKPKFEIVSFGIFRKCQQLPNTGRRMTVANSSNYANVARAATSPPTRITVPASSQVSSPGAVQPRGAILRNRHGQRVDPPLSYNESDFKSVKNRKLCNRFFLLGKCSFMENFGECSHKHEGDLSEDQKSALRAVARLSPYRLKITTTNTDVPSSLPIPSPSTTVTMSNYYSTQQPQYPPTGQPNAAQNLQFFPSQYSNQPSATPQQGYGYANQGGYGVGAAQNFASSPGFGAQVSGRMGEQGGLRTGWVAAFTSEGYDGEPPLLEELGVNFGHIQAKTLAVLNPFRRIDSHIMDDSDLAGPLIFFLLFGFILLFSGQVHFGYIYGLAALGSISLHLILSLMSPSGTDAAQVNSYPQYSSDPSAPPQPHEGQQGGHFSATLTYPRSASVLGYCLLPLVATSLFGIVMRMDTPFGIVATTAAILWCTYSASGMFCAVGQMKRMRGLVAYPLALFYVGFGIMGIFSSRGSGTFSNAATKLATKA